MIRKTRISHSLAARPSTRGPPPPVYVIIEQHTYGWLRHKVRSERFATLSQKIKLKRAGANVSLKKPSDGWIYIPPRQREERKIISLIRARVLSSPSSRFACTRVAGPSRDSSLIRESGEAPGATPAAKLRLPPWYNAPRT